MEENDLGVVFFSRVAFRLDDKNAPEPDIGFVAKKNLRRVQRGSVHGAPDLAIEIVSPESVERDYKKKRSQFERFSVPEYWIFDEIMETQKWLALGPKGKYREIRPKNKVLKSTILPGFWLRPEWLWTNPRPKKNDVLQRILAQ